MQPIERCPICGGADLRPFAMDAWAPHRLHFVQARCGDCGLLAAQPQASATEADSYYKGWYYEEQWPDPDAVWALNTKLYGQYELPLMQRLWADWAPPPGGAVVEIGCGYGLLLELLRRAGYHVRGCDLSPKAVRFCQSKGLDVIEGKTPGVPFAVGAFDVSVSMHVIEHVPDPRGFVNELVELVRPGGIVVLVTEDIWISQYVWDRVRARLFGRIPPFRSSTDHTFLFQGEHLKMLLSAAGCGDVRLQSFTYIPQIESLHWRLYKGLFRMLDRLFGHGEFMMAVGRRAGPRTI